MSEERKPWDVAAERLYTPPAGARLSDGGQEQRRIAEIVRAACEHWAASETARLREQLKRANEDAAEDDTRIRDLCRPILGADKTDGDSNGVPGLVDVVSATIHVLAHITDEAKNEALRSQVAKLREALTKIADGLPRGDYLTESAAQRAFASEALSATPAPDRAKGKP